MDNRDKTKGGIRGLATTNTESGIDEIRIVPESNLLRMMQAYFHEIGHSIGSKLSFQEGETLTPAECSTTSIPINIWEKIGLSTIATLEGLDIPLRLDPLTKRICDRILKAYTKGKWDPKSVDFSYATSDPIARKLLKEQKGDLATMGIDPNLKLTPKWNREGRNREMPSIGTERDCMTILYNSFGKKYESKPINPERWHRSSHNRAAKLVDYIRNRGEKYVVPSMKDIGTRQPRIK